MMRTVLITDGEQRAALALVRSLGAAGYRCVVASRSGRSIAGASRHAQAERIVPSPETAPEEFAAEIARIIASVGADLLIPVAEPSLLALLPVRNQLGAELPFADAEAFRRICDKAAVLHAAACAGISVPAQTELRSPADAEGVDFVWPVVLKPARSVFTDAHGVRGKVSVSWAHSTAELRAALAAYPSAAFPVLAQRAVRGPGIGVFVLLDEERVVAQFAHRRVREKPPSGGVSVLRQSEPMNAELLRRSVDLLRAFGWTGVAMVEYKLDETTGEAFLMEINGRFWGSLQLAIDAGVDFPRLLAAASFREPVNPVESYRFVRSRWFWGDVDHVIGVWRDARSTRRARFASLAGLVRAFGPGYTSEVFRWSDPVPFLVESRQWFSSVLRQ